MLKRSTTLVLVCLLLIQPLTSHASSKSLSKTNDLGVINKERIVYWLEKRGELAPNATIADQQAALNNYLATRKGGQNALPGKLGALKNKKHLETLHKMQSSGVSSAKSSPLKSIALNKAVTQTNTSVKVLAILIDFQDLKFNNHRLSAADTDMFYESYPKSHYQNLLFSTTGYNGPSNQNIESAYQYYQHESGQSFSLTGNTYGWVSADNDASYYGSNNNDDNDSNVSELVIEAVTKAVAEEGLNLADYDQVNNADFTIEEPDGVVDHLMIFHSSIGEEAGGGVLGSEAIWSHRFAVTNEQGQPMSIDGSATKIFGYTITPIDSATGVVVHEFAHNLGLIDEYDTASIDIGAPVSGWSVMSSGSWLGSPRGTKPNSFSPYARDYFQTRYGGNWVNQTTVEFNDQLNETITLNSATNHDNVINQIKVNLPKTQTNFGAPFEGEYQYYSNSGHQISNKLSFTATIGASDPALTMKARWDIEQDYDYVLVKVNGRSISGNFTKVINPRHSGVTFYLTGKSIDEQGASGLGWVDLNYDLFAFRNQSVDIEIEYVTDEAVGGYGIAIDNIKISDNSTTTFENGAETLSSVTLDGFSRIQDSSDDEAQYYYVQLRDYSSTDSSLSTLDYDPGVLIWYSNDGVEDNNVSLHAGEVFTGVVDADQTLIKRNGNILDTERQLRDAAFSLYDQTPSPNDTSLTNKALFKDSDDYSSPAQPESGINLPKFGLNIEVITQETNSSSATVALTNAGIISASQTALTVNLSVIDSKTTPLSTYTWNMGDGTILSGAQVEHTYLNAGSYNVSVNYTNSAGTDELLTAITVAPIIDGNITLNNSTSASVSYSALLSGGLGDYIYRWNFGDDEGSSSLQQGNYTYKNSGTYAVTLTVTDDTGVSFDFVENVTVLNPLALSFNSSKTNLLVNFTSSASGGSKPYSYLWNFGDSNTSVDDNPSHTYASAGSYSVSLTITDADGETINSTSNVSVTAAAVTSNSNSSNNTTSSSSDSSGGSVSWLLLFGLLTICRIKYDPAY